MHEIKRLFNHLDVDKNQTISVSEIDNFLISSAQKGGWSPSEIDALNKNLVFKEADASADNALNWLEFLSFVARMAGAKETVNKDTLHSGDSKHFKAALKLKAFFLRRVEIEARTMATNTMEKYGLRKALPKAASRHKMGQMESLLVLLQRATLREFRSLDEYVFSIFLFMIGALVIGLVQGTERDILSFGNNQLLPLLTLGLLSTVTALRTFGSDRILFWRESASGISVLSYFLAHAVVDLLPIIILPLVYSGIFYALTYPFMRFTEYYYACMLVTWACYGMSYMLSAVISPNKAMLGGVTTAMILGGFFSGVNPTLQTYKGSPSMLLCAVSYARYAVEALIIHEFRAWPWHYTNQKVYMLASYGFCDYDDTLTWDEAEVISWSEGDLDHCDKDQALRNLAYLGFAFRVGAVILLKFTNRDKQV
mmetsp:Transcript_31169/g.101620  ORF Transcript_31169/g.101620 Transcript_31169/m.101620 type:complete len:425 (-) Transcript_31169:946-2220(-)